MTLTNTTSQDYDFPTAPHWAVGFGDLNHKRRNALLRCAFFMPISLWWAVWGIERCAGACAGSPTRAVRHPLFGDTVAVLKSQETTIMNNALLSFDFASISIRIKLISDQPWFVAADVCRILGIKNPSDALKSLDQDEKTTLDNTEGQAGKGAQRFNLVNESGLYALIFKSRKPVAKKFRKWVTNEVLPAIRKTGSYSVAEPRTTYQPITRQQLNELSHAIHMASINYKYQNQCSQGLANRIRVMCNIHRIEAIPASRFDEVMDMVAEVKKSNQIFSKLMHEMILEYHASYIAAGVPWTPHLKRMWKKQFEAKLPERPDWLEVAKTIEHKGNQS